MDFRVYFDCVVKLFPLNGIVYATQILIGRFVTNDVISILEYRSLSGRLVARVHYFPNIGQKYWRPKGKWVRLADIYIYRFPFCKNAYNEFPGYFDWRYPFKISKL